MDFANHPCFSEGARHKFGRIHLPVAPKCNIQCNYCNRDFDCLNESRPGVTSQVLTPRQAVGYLEAVLRKIGNISVVGIAGPGDPFANAFETMETLRLVRQKYPEMLLCVATNGLEILPYVDELARLKISHVTVTVNTLDPVIGGRIYNWARLNGRMYRGAEAAQVILARQLEAIRRLKEKGIVVKVNTVVIPGINDGQVGDLARHMAVLDADIMNCMPLYHVAGTALETITPPSAEMMTAIRATAATYLPQMSHCGRCRADAAGMIGQQHNEEIISLLKEASQSWGSTTRPHVAVASMEGIFVNQHLGEAAALWIFGLENGSAALIDRRSTPPTGSGQDRWVAMAELLHDCNTVLVGGVGRNPQRVLERAGIRVVAMEGLAAEAVEAVLQGREIPRILLHLPGRCGVGKGCSGTGVGCG